MPKTTKKTTKKDKKAPGKKMEWNDSDELRFWKLMDAPPREGEKFSKEYREYEELRRRRAKFKIQEINAGREVKYK